MSTLNYFESPWFALDIDSHEAPRISYSAGMRSLSFYYKDLKKKYDSNADQNK